VTSICAVGISDRPRTPGPIFVSAVIALVVLTVGCGGSSGDVTTRPDSLLRAELGLSDQDEVHRVMLAGGEQERFTPEVVEIGPGAWVEFVSADWRVHEIRFEVDSLPGEARMFLERSDQVASPPLVDQGARFLVSFAGAPDGRYPFMAEGNGAPGRGVVVVGSTR